MEQAKERWGLTILMFFVIACIFSFLLVMGSREGVTKKLLQLGFQEQKPGDGVLYNYHSFDSRRIGALRSDREPETVNERPRGAGEPAEGPALEPKGFIYHKVQSGDSLWKIARKYNIEISDIVKHNSIRNPDVIYAGSTLKIMLKSS